MCYKQVYLIKIKIKMNIKNKAMKSKVKKLKQSKCKVLGKELKTTGQLIS